MNRTVLRACAWSGPGCVLLFLMGFGVIAGFIPPPSPRLGAHQIAELIRENKNQIRTGMIVSALASALIAPWVAGLSVHLKRIEGECSPLSYLQLGLGMLLVLEFIFPLMFWQVATFRTQRSDVVIQMINDLAWIPFVALTVTVIVQALVVGVAILTDQHETPIFPRWAGYLSLFAAMTFCGGSFTVFFKDGLLAWNGLIAWYVPLSVFCIWLVVMTSLMFRATARQDVFSERN